MTLLARYKTYYQGAHYHIFNRGVARQSIFVDDHDYYQYLKRLERFKNDYGCTVLCYCLMPNHLHLLVKQNYETPILKFIQSAHTSYSMYFNRRYDRIGPLFQDRFKCKTIDNDAYLLHLSRYIHANPAVSGFVKNPEEYRWSSFQNYTGKRQGILCDISWLIKMGLSPENLNLMNHDQYYQFVMEALPALKERKRVEHAWDAYLRGEINLSAQKSAEGTVP